MPYLTQAATFTYNSTTSPCRVPIGYPVVHDEVPGRMHVGAQQVEPPFPGGRRSEITGVQFDLRGQTASGTAFPEGIILQAAGFAKTGTTAYTYALGDLHGAADTPAGDLTPLTTCILNIDGSAYTISNVVADLSFLFEAGQHPKLTANFYGQAAAAWADVVKPSVTVGALPAMWNTAAVTIGGTSAEVISIEVTVGNAIQHRRSANQTYAYNQSRPSGRLVTGVIRMEAVALSALNVEDKWLNRTSTALVWTYLGAASGNTYPRLNFTQTVYLLQPRWVDQNGFTGWELPFMGLASSGPLTVVFAAA